MKQNKTKKTTKPTAVVAIGVFDGVHLGHRALLSALKRMARQTHATPIALTFRNHPEDVLAGGPRVPFLLEREASFRLLKKYGAEKVTLIPFTKAFARKPAEGFVNWMTQRFHLKGVVVGADFRFGRGAEGDVDFLRREGLKRGFKVMAVKPIKSGSVRISSNRIRLCLQEGRLDEANRLLDRPYNCWEGRAWRNTWDTRSGSPRPTCRTCRRCCPRTACTPARCPSRASYIGPP
jgi:riboflavin kinase/FMN adenylyltransferase